MTSSWTFKIIPHMKRYAKLKHILIQLLHFNRTVINWILKKMEIVSICCHLRFPCLVCIASILQCSNGEHAGIYSLVFARKLSYLVMRKSHTWEVSAMKFVFEAFVSGVGPRWLGPKYRDVYETLFLKPECETMGHFIFR